VSTIDGYVHPAFASVAEQFRRLHAKPGSGGGSLAVQLRDEPMLDVWSGFADHNDTHPWTADTMAMSFSTTKGVAATVIHRLADRGLISYDEAVATYWPEFGAAGKQRVTVRQVLSHQAGLHAIAPLIRSPEELLDHHHMESLLAAATPRPRPGTGPGYHGFTFGWLLSGLARAVTGKDMRDLVQEELAGPLKTDGLHIGIQEEDRDRVAPLLFSNWGPVTLLGSQGHRLKWTSRLRDAFFIEDFDELLEDPDQRIIAAQMPAVSGVFTARALATMYGALANGGTVDGTELLSRSTVHELGRVVTRDRDYILGVRMRWRLGYHQAFAGRKGPRRGFGHFGFGGSGGWADPATGLSIGFVTSRLGSATTPIADARLYRLGAAAVEAAARLV